MRKLFALVDKTNGRVAELDNGAVMLNLRSALEDERQRKFYQRAVAISDDGGETFGPTRPDPALPVPACQATLLRYSWSDQQEWGGKSRLLFCNPAVGRSQARFRMTVKLSYDDGKTWPVSRVIFPGYSAYSAMTVLPDGRIGLLYEKDDYRRISFVAFSLGWLTEETD